MAYSGSDRFLWTTHGIYFPQRELAQDARIEILVATEVRWVFGAPGLAKQTRREEIEYVPGVFVGEILEDLASDVLMTRAVPDNAS
jgi:hypothetical protein